MSAYSRIDAIEAAPQYGNTGQNGWGFTLWNDSLDDEAPHRQVLLRFAAAFPEAKVALPAYDRYEDFVECYATWNSQYIWICFETILSHLWIWSKNRDAVEGFRVALLPLID